MHIQTYATPKDVLDIGHTLQDHYVIVIDVLRATSVAITAMHNGARGIIPVNEVEDAMRVYRNLDHENALLCGERNSQPITGFHMGNSPLEYSPDHVQGCTLIFTTTNGTRAMFATENAYKVALGGMLNADSVVSNALSSGCDIVLLCAGTNGKFSLDDALTAGMLIHSMGNYAKHMDDLSYVCLHLYQQSKNNILSALRNCSHVQDLCNLGYEEDVKFCMQPNIMKVVPIYSKGYVKL